MHLPVLFTNGIRLGLHAHIPSFSTLLLLLLLIASTFVIRLSYRPYINLWIARNVCIYLFYWFMRRALIATMQFKYNNVYFWRLQLQFIIWILFNGCTINLRPAIVRCGMKTIDDLLWCRNNHGKFDLRGILEKLIIIIMKKEHFRWNCFRCSIPVLKCSGVPIIPGNVDQVHLK